MNLMLLRANRESGIGSRESEAALRLLSPILNPRPPFPASKGVAA